MNTIIYILKFFFSAYFTNEPHNLYKKACAHGNFAYSGVALKLIFSQYAFWISNSINVLNICLYSTIKNYMYINWLLIGLSIFLYIRSIQSILYVMKITGNPKTQ